MAFNPYTACGSGLPPVSVVVGPAQVAQGSPVENVSRSGWHRQLVATRDAAAWDAARGGSVQMGGVPTDLGRALYNVRQRLKANRKQIKKACYACRLKKAKCDDARPCKRCIATGKAGTCCDDFREEEERNVDDKSLLELAVVQRPLREKVGISLDDGMVPGHADLAAQLPAALKFFWNVGHPEDKLRSVFNSLPTRLATIATRMVRAVDVVMQYKADQARAALPAGWFLEHTPLQLPMHSVNDVYSGESRVGAWMNPTDLTRLGMAISFNSSQLTGIHPEEYTSRAGNHDVALPFSDVDTFCLLMDDLLHMERDQTTRYFVYNRFLYSQATCPTTNCLLKWEVEKTMDPCGAYLQIICKFTLATTEEYNEVRQAMPHACRPLRHILAGGPDLSAEELLMADHTLDTFDMLTRTEEGQRQCDRLAAHLEEKAAPLLHMAEMVAGTDLMRLKGKWKCAAVEELS